MLKDIRETILRDSRKEGESSLRKAEASLEAEFAKVKEEGESVVDAAGREGLATTAAEKRERLSWSKLEAKRILTEAREDAVNAAFDDLVEKVKKYASTGKYASKVKPQVAAAAKELGPRAIVRVRKGNKRAFSVEGAEVRDDADIMGGAIVESRNGKFRIDLSIEATLDARRDSMRKEIYKRLFK